MAKIKKGSPRQTGCIHEETKSRLIKLWDVFIYVVQVLLSFCLLSGNVKAKIRETTVFNPPSMFVGVKLVLSPRGNVTLLERLKTEC